VPFDFVHGLEFLVVLLPTLQGYYFYQIGAAPLPLIGFLILFFLLCRPDITATFALRDCRYFLAILSLFLASILIGLFSEGGGALNGETGTAVRNYFGNMAGPVFAIGFVSYFRTRSHSLIRYLNITLLLHMTAIIGQYFCLYVLGFYPDLLFAITGEKQRYESSMLRPTGLFSEPGHYAIFAIALVFMINRFSSPLTTLQFVALITILSNFSLLGTFLIVSFMLCYWLFSPKHLVIKVITGIVFVIILQFPIGDLITQRVASRVIDLQDDTSFTFRFIAALDYFNTLPTISKLFGTGLGNFEGFTSYGSTYTYFLLHLGIVPTCSLFAIVCRYLRLICRVNFGALGFMAALLIGSLMPTYMMFWMTIAAVGVLEKTKDIRSLKRMKTRAFRVCSIPELYVDTADGLAG